MISQLDKQQHPDLASPVDVLDGNQSGLNTIPQTRQQTKTASNSASFYQRGLEIATPGGNGKQNNPYSSVYFTNSAKPHQHHSLSRQNHPQYPLPEDAVIAHSSSAAPLLGSNGGCRPSIVKSNTTESTLSNVSISSIDQPQIRQRWVVFS